MISLRYPSYAVRHPVHTSWLNHRMREDYDLWERMIAPLSSAARLKGAGTTAPGALARSLLPGARDQVVRAVEDDPGAAGEKRVRRGRALPTGAAPALRRDEYGDYVFVVSRLAPHKRVDLVVRALAEPAAAGIRCVIAGTGEELPNLRRLAVRLGVDGRVEFLGRIDDAALVRRLAGCRAVCFPPYQEDYGLVTVEAFASARPVITCTDSGGPAELVQHGVQGLVCEPNPPALAEAMRAVMEDRDRAAVMGEAARATATGISWQATVERLVVR